MPTYQYSCTDCGHFFEAFQSFSDDSLTECPECGGTLRKVFNAVGVVFKGSGFYRTDSRSNGAKADATSSGKSEGSSSEGAATSSTGSTSGSSDSGSSGSNTSGSSGPSTSSAPAPATT